MRVEGRNSFLPSTCALLHICISELYILVCTHRFVLLEPHVMAAKQGGANDLLCHAKTPSPLLVYNKPTLMVDLPNLSGYF